MKQPKHTPGPWSYNENSQLITTASDFLIARDCNVPDCKLVAAAPELLEALQLYVKYQGFRMIEGTDCEKRFKAAIAKATGGAE